jgi:uncharacterized Zn-binding protein involved in type VI secretion
MAGKKLSRKGDKNTTGGKIERGAGTVFCNNKPVALHTSTITPHDPKRDKQPHNKAKTTEGSPTVFAENVPVLRVGSGNTCGHKIVEGSDNVFVD